MANASPLLLIKRGAKYLAPLSFSQKSAIPHPQSPIGWVHIKFWQARVYLCWCCDRLSTNGNFRNRFKPTPVRSELVEEWTADDLCSFNSVAIKCYAPQSAGQTHGNFLDRALKTRSLSTKTARRGEQDLAPQAGNKQRTQNPRIRTARRA